MCPKFRLLDSKILDLNRFESIQLEMNSSTKKDRSFVILIRLEMDSSAKKDLPFF